MQTILGSGGPIGTELAKALTRYTNDIRLVSRVPVKVNPSDELFPADLLQIQAVKKAVSGSEIVYLTAGLPYNYSTWAKEWPVIVTNVIEACMEFDTKLVFFDNMYLYDSNQLGKMTETATVNPPSKKGVVRAKIAEMIMQEVWTGTLSALIARSADFYGPGIKNNSILIETVFKPLSQNQKAKWMGSAQYKHSFTYTPDAGKATALLGNTEDAYGQVWHLPTAPDPLTGEEWVNCIAKAMDKKPGYWEIPKWMVRAMGVFMPIMRETVEMMYQYEQDYVFDSSKFCDRFKMRPTPYKEGVREVVQADFRNL